MRKIKKTITILVAIVMLFAIGTVFTGCDESIETSSYPSQRDYLIRQIDELQQQVSDLLEQISSLTAQLEKALEDNLELEGLVIVIENLTNQVAQLNAQINHYRSLLGIEHLSPVIALSHEAGFYDEAFDLTVRFPYNPVAVIYYTIDGTEPRPGAPRTITRSSGIITVSGRVPANGIMRVADRTNDWHSLPLTSHSQNWQARYSIRPANNARILAGTAFRFRAFVGDRPVSDIITATYIVAPNATQRFANTPVMAITASYQDLIYIYTNADRWSPNIPYRRIFYYEYFEVNEETNRYKRQFNIRASTQLGGSWTRIHAQRTLNLHVARGGLTGVITHPIFDGVDDFVRFRLWNGGNNFVTDHMRDAFTQQASANAGLNVLHSRQQVAVKFINGEFWGFTQMREHTSNQEFVITHTGMNRGNVAIVDRTMFQDNNFYDVEADGGSATMRLHEELNSFILQNLHNFYQDSMVERLFTEFLCEDNFIDYHISNTFFNNTDWPHNNVRFYRAINPVDDGNPHNDGRWRFILHDMDHSMGGTGTRFSALYGPRNIRGPEFNYLYRIFNNRAFVERFVFRARYVVANHLTEEMLTNLYNEFADQLVPLLPEMYNRFTSNHNNPSQSITTFNNNRNSRLAFIHNRHNHPTLNFNTQLYRLINRLA
ncbi:MAG: CotH kinase family protein [Firmicutes bacterium]|nr:CotH kinase family protein [Bacillota bacterium]